MDDWWHENERGQIGYIVHEETIRWLEDQLGRDHVVDVETLNGQKQKCTTI